MMFKHYHEHHHQPVVTIINTKEFSDRVQARNLLNKSHTNDSTLPKLIRRLNKDVTMSHVIVDGEEKENRWGNKNEVEDDSIESILTVTSTWGGGGGWNKNQDEDMVGKKLTNKSSSNVNDMLFVNHHQSSMERFALNRGGNGGRRKAHFYSTINGQSLEPPPPQPQPHPSLPNISSRIIKFIILLSIGK